MGVSDWPFMFADSFPLIIHAYIHAEVRTCVHTCMLTDRQADTHAYACVRMCMHN